MHTAGSVRREIWQTETRART